MREREIALKEKELELRMSQAQGNENSVEKERVRIEGEKLFLSKKQTKAGWVLFVIVFLIFIMFIIDRMKAQEIRRQQMQSAFKEAWDKQQNEFDR